MRRFGIVCPAERPRRDGDAVRRRRRRGHRGRRCRRGPRGCGHARRDLRDRRSGTAGPFPPRLRRPSDEKCVPFARSSRGCRWLLRRKWTPTSIPLWGDELHSPFDGRRPARGRWRTLFEGTWWTSRGGVTTSLADLFGLGGRGAHGASSGRGQETGMGAAVVRAPTARLALMFLGRVRSIHFVGIGGIGMSGLAESFRTLVVRRERLRFLKRNENTRRLESRGARIFTGTRPVPCRWAPTSSSIRARCRRPIPRTMTRPSRSNSRRFRAPRCSPS